MTDWRKNNLSFTAQEKRALVIIAVIVFICILIPRFLAYNSISDKFSVSIEEQRLMEINQQKTKYKKKTYKKYTKKNYPKFEKKEAISYLPDKKFNPDTLSFNDWKNLGFSDKQIASILKGKDFLGGIHSIEDLGKIYILDSAKIATWKPFLVFTKKPFLIVELNHANQEDLEKVKGIGPFLSKQIIIYRDKLGGYNDMNQLNEVFGMKPELIDPIKNHLKIDPSAIKMIAINNIDASQLSKHPYLNYNKANSIVEYRKQHGFYKKPADLLKSRLISEEDLVKLTPYLNFE